MATKKRGQKPKNTDGMFDLFGLRKKGKKTERRWIAQARGFKSACTSAEKFALSNPEFIRVEVVEYDTSTIVAIATKD